MDAIDKKIISLLKNNGRITNSELAERVNLSPTPCLRRLKRLEDKGIIVGYQAKINHRELGNNVSALTSVTLQKSTIDNARHFEHVIGDMPFVESCYTVSGSHDYVIKINAATLSDIERILKEQIAAIAVIDKLETTIILNEL